MRRFLLITLTALLSAIISVTLCFVSFAEEDCLTATNESDIVNNIKEGAYIRLGADITVDSEITVSVSDVTVDLNGHTLKANKYSQDGSQITTLFALSGSDLNFTICGSGALNVGRAIVDTSAANNSAVYLSASGEGITVTTPDAEYTSFLFKIGKSNGSVVSSLNISGKVSVLTKCGITPFVIYGKCKFNINSAELYSEIHPETDTNGYGTPKPLFSIYSANKTTVSEIKDSTLHSECGTLFNFLGTASSSYVANISAEGSQLYAVSTLGEGSGAVSSSTGRYANLSFDSCKIFYTDTLFAETSTAVTSYRVTATLNDTDTELIGAGTDSAMINGAVKLNIYSGFHNLGNAAPYSTSHNLDKTGAGFLVFEGTSFNKSIGEDSMIDIQDGLATAVWHSDSETVLAVGYYAVGSSAQFDISSLPVIKTGNSLFNLRYTSWGNTLISEQGTYNFYPDESSLAPTPAISGIKYNLTTFTSYRMNVYVPEEVKLIGVYSDNECKDVLSGRTHSIGNNRYNVFSIDFGVAETQKISFYVKYCVTYNSKEFTLVQTVSQSISDYAKIVLEGDSFTQLEKTLVADMIRYSNEAYKIIEGKYNSDLTTIVDKYSEYLTNYGELNYSAEKGNTDDISEYISGVCFTVGEHEPCYSFVYTTALEDSGLELRVSYLTSGNNVKSATLTRIDTAKMLCTSHISISDITSTLTIEIYDANKGEAVAEGTYSIYDYIAGLDELSIDTTFAKSLLAYSKSSLEYKNSKS
jgi:hypothetical protein